VAALSLWLFGGHLGRGLQSLMRECFQSISSFNLTVANLFYFSRAFCKAFLYLLGPVMAILFFFALVSNIMQFGWLFTAHPLKPNLAKVFGPEAFKKLFSMDKVMELFKSIFKMTIVGIIGYLVIKKHYEEYIFLADQSVAAIVALIAKVLLELVLKCAALLVILGIIDFFYQRYKTKKGLKMTKQEVKDEMKSMEGDPQIKGKIRNLRMEMHRKMMMTDVPKATVVVTNPTYIAIAIRYQQGNDAAPVVVAKGKRLIAQKIKQLAVENDIPIVEDKPLARSMYDLIQVGETIPEEFFGAVAEILAYVYNLKNRNAESALA
jgi:flagellar biosynthetic protein FlhB